MFLYLALTITPLAVLACVLLYVAGASWGIAAVVLILVVLNVHWSRRYLGDGRGARPAGLQDQEPARPETSTAVVIAALHREPASVRGTARASGAAADAILPAYAYEKRSGGEGECSVCLGEVRPGEVVKRLPACLHVFHEGCIDMWLSSHATCPICRSPVDAGAVAVWPAGVAARVQP